MSTTVTSDLWRVLNPLRLAGPIFDKELRVASRQRRTYVLRFVYVALLSLAFVTQVLNTYFVQSALGGSSSVARVSQMGQMAMNAVLVVIWVQFLAGQLLAIVLLSGAIGDEVRKHSLDVLLVSPISSVQVVLGKLFSRLLQLVLLLAVGLPMLAVIRAFGGVPWESLVAATCITLTAVVFTGSLSLFLSAAHRNSQSVTAGAILWCLIAWVGIPVVLSFLHWKGHVGASVVETVSCLSNPFLILGRETRMMMTPGARLATPLTSWPMHCAVMLGVSVVILLLAMYKVRRAAQGAVGGNGEVRGGQQVASSRWNRFCGKAIRRVRGSPIVWRELVRPVFSRGWRGAVQMILLALVICGGVAALIYVFVNERSQFNTLCFVAAVLFEILFAFAVASSAASAIAREKEARALAVLLTIPCDDKIILRGKVIGILRRGLPLLALAIAFGLLAMLSTPDSPGPNTLMVIARFEIGLAGSVIFLMGLGLCLSAYLKTTTAAQALTLGIFVIFSMFSSIASTFLQFFGFGVFGGHGVILWTLIVGVIKATIYSVVGVVLYHVAAGAFRSRCQR